MSQKLAETSAHASTAGRSTSNIRALGIVIPAHNQAAAISRCIASLFASNSHSGWHNSLWIVVVADACTDDTAAAAREALGAFGQVLEVCASSAQAAHRIGASAVMEHFRDVPRHTLLLTTADAAAGLPLDWITVQLRGADSPTAPAANH